MCLCLKKNFAFQKQQDLLNMSGSCFFLGFVIFLVKIHLTACLVFYLVMIFLLKLLGLKIHLHSPSGPSSISYYRAHCEGKKKKIDPSHESVQSLHFLTWPKLEAIFSQIKGSSHEFNLLCDRKYKHEIEENRKVLALIIDTTITLGWVGLPFCVYRDDSKYHPKVVEYSTGGVGNFVEFLQFMVRGGDKTAVGMQVIFQRLHKMTLLVAVGSLL